MSDQAIIEAQLDFFRKGSSGCLFAAHVAQEPVKYGWNISVCEPDALKIRKLVLAAISSNWASTQSIILPDVRTEEEFANLLVMLTHIEEIVLKQKEKYGVHTCLGYRVVFGGLTSWLIGFGNFDFLPKTRQSLFTEIAFRCKPKSSNLQEMKPAEPTLLHLAHMDLLGMTQHKFLSLWHGTIDHTEEVLGNPQDVRSKAKTTFAVPSELYEKIRLKV